MAVKKIHFRITVDLDEGMCIKVSQIAGDME
jgi:hypothetical protein